MKKILTSITILAALYACNKQQTELTINEDGKQIITATVSIPSTKVSYSENTPGGGTGLCSTWDAGDHFYAIQKTGEEVSVVTFNLKSGAGSSSAIFQTTTSGVTDETQWTAVLGSNATASETVINCSYKNQVGTLAGLDGYNYVKSTATGTAPSFDFNPGTGMSYIMRIKLPAGVKCIEYTPSAYWQITDSETKEMYYTPAAFGWSDSDYAYSAFEPANTSTITLESASTYGQTVYIAIPAINFSYTAKSDWNSGTKYGNLKSGVIVTLLNDISDDATLSNGAVMGADLHDKGGQIGTFDMTEYTLAARPRPADAITFTKVGTSQYKSEAYAGEQKYLFTGESFGETYHYYRDVLFQKAVSISTKWAPYDLGASDSSSPGSLFGWGEVESRDSFKNGTNAHYGHNSTFYDVIAAQYKLNAIKVNSSRDGQVCFSIAGSRYDPARVKWGVAWRMPHDLELEHMLAASAMVSGNTITISADGGSSILIQLTNSSNYKGLSRTYASGASKLALYWGADSVQRSGSSTGNTDKAYCFAIWDNSGKKFDYYQAGMRWEGLYIRPVLASSAWNIE